MIELHKKTLSVCLRFSYLSLKIFKDSDHIPLPEFEIKVPDTDNHLL